MVVFVSFLMVSSIEFEKIPRFDRDSVRERKWTFAFFFFYLLLIIIKPDYGLMAVILIYISKAIVQSAIRFFRDDYAEDEGSFHDFS